MVRSSMYDSNYIPVRGDVMEINMNPQAGREIWDRRPALVLSSWNFNQTKNLTLPVKSPCFSLWDVDGI